MSWKEELDFLKKRCLEREAVVLPDIMREWFDMNRRDDRPDRAYIDDLADRLKVWAAGNSNPLTEWIYHTDAYGWRIKMLPFRREADGDIYVLVDATRDRHASVVDYKRLAMMIKHLGGDYDKDLLMHVDNPHGATPHSFWSWPATRGKA